jgi:putative glutamine amidotransferase
MKIPSDAPLIGVIACVRDLDDQPFHTAGEKYLTGVAIGAEGLPMVIPSLGAAYDAGAVVRRFDGLLVTGSPSNVAVDLYGGGPDRQESPQDPARDATTLPLIRAALAAGLPMLCICRGLQELNVALGGTLDPQVHLAPGRLDHRAPRNVSFAERFAPRHGVRFDPNGQFQRLLGRHDIEVNSLHWQGIEHPAADLVVEGWAPDGVIEAVSVRDAPGFALGVQWHPEFRVQDNPVSMALFRAFGEAARRHGRARG